jgi:hypothetical protein
MLPLEQFSAKKVEPYYSYGFDIADVNTGEIINGDWR